VDDPTWDAVVVAGGAGLRMGGTDKPALNVAAGTLLDIALTACAGARNRVVVGPRRPTREPVRWTREDPPGSGPLAGLGAGLSSLPEGSDVVVVLAADLPFVDPDVIKRLRAAIAAQGDVDGAVVVDADGRAQPLLAAYRRRSLEWAVASMGVLRDRPVREILNLLAVTTVLDPVAARDIDTREDLHRWFDERARRP
jgi:molybdopterin-guanine dinucleotide biosynthesis protein A